MKDEMTDICYKCGKVQEYGTMQDIKETDFDIFCDDCYKKNQENKIKNA